MTADSDLGEITIPELDRSALPGPETIERRVLDNGVTVLARENFASPSVVVHGYLPAGALLESPGQAGLANLTASALMRGTRNRTFNEIYSSVESIGASLDIGAGTHFTSFRGKCLAQDLPTLLGLLGEVLRWPAFPEREFKLLRSERLTGLTLRDQNTRAVADMTFDELTYAGHPYRLPSSGYRETVAKLSVDDLRAFHSQNYGPSGLVIVVVGGVHTDRAVAQVSSELGDWMRGTEQSSLEVQTPPQLSERVQRAVVLEGKTQADIVLGVSGPSRSDEAYLPAALGNSILGRFGLMGRIGDAVRERAGLAYYAYSSISGGVGPGPWSFAAGVDPANVERAVDLIVQEINRFTSELVTREEILENQANFVGRLPLQLESNEGVAGALAHIERHDLGLDYYQMYPERITGITREQILQAAKKFLSTDRLAVAIAGPELEQA